VEDGKVGLVDVDLIKSDFFLFFTQFSIIPTFQYSISRVPTDRLKNNIPTIGDAKTFKYK